MIYVALVGLTLIITHGTIFGWLQRLWPEFFRCCQCVGFWVGAHAGGIGFVELGIGRGWFVNAFFVGCITSIYALLTHGVLIRLLGDPEE